MQTFEDLDLSAYIGARSAIYVLVGREALLKSDELIGNLRRKHC